MITFVSKRAAMLAMVLAVLGTVSSGCGKDKKRVVVSVPGPTLATLWPNQDGYGWTFRIEQRTWSDTLFRYYANVNDVAPAPSMAELVNLLASHAIGSAADTMMGNFRIAFDGMITTQSGVTAQNLKESYPASLRDARAWSSPAGGSALLEQLIRARPDLRRKIEALLPSLPADQGSVLGSTLIHGYAWRKTTAWIGSYGDLDTLLAWKFLSSNLSIGGEFSHQLVPALASDVFMHGRILRKRNVATAAGTYANALECLYLIDFGISEFRDDQGNPLGFARQFTYGTVAYADSAGPVASYERRLVESGNPPSHGVADANLVLSATGLPPVSAMAR